jgi:hypothetical protein
VVVASVLLTALVLWFACRAMGMESIV